MRFRFLSMTAILGLACLLAGTGAGQSVADVAKKNKEQNKDKKARVVITNATLKSGEKGAAPAGEGEAKTAPSAGKDSPGAAAGREKAQGKVDQEYRDKYRKMIQDLRKMEKNQSEAESRYAWSSAAGWQRKAKEQRKKIDDLKEEARKAGVEPGVFRQVDKELERSKK
jgi:hypothetical protein